jgi:hypothetical protein
MNAIHFKSKMIFQNLMLAIIVCFQLVLASGTNRIGTAAATFLRIPVGARAMGMGNAFVSMTDDPSAIYWNPSVLPSLKTNAVVLDHSTWLPGIDFDYFGVILPFESLGTIGISTTFLHTEEMLVTTYLDQMGSYETFTASSLELGISYSKSLTDRFAIGGTFKYIRETIYNSNASGIAFDVGTIFVTPFSGIRLGASITNFGTKMQMEGEDLNVRVDIAPDQKGNNQSIVGRITTDEFDLPLMMRIGISGEVIETDNFRWTLSMDGVNPNDNMQSVNIGSELSLLHETIQIRVGYRDLFLDENEFGIAYGFGLNQIRIAGNISISLDYGYQKYMHLGYSNRFTMGLRF